MAQDTLKVSGIQVSPVEIENVLLAHPKALINDVSVAGVSGGRTSDEKVPRAWIVLSGAGKKLGAHAVIRELEMWHKENLSKYKWLRGGIEVVEEVRLAYHDWGWRGCLVLTLVPCPSDPQIADRKSPPTGTARQVRAAGCSECERETLRLDVVYPICA